MPQPCCCRCQAVLLCDARCCLVGCRTSHPAQELVWRGSEPLVVLRLLVLLSGTCGGLPRKHADSLRSEFLSAYGHQHLLTLHNLEKAGACLPTAC